MSVRFDFEWADFPSSADPVCSATMASFKIEAGEKTVTTVRDTDNGVKHDHVVIPLFQVAEWLVGNWFFLFNEIGDVDEVDSDRDFAERHNLYFAGAGYVLPKITIIPSGNRIYLNWTGYESEHARLKYLSFGADHVDRWKLESQFRAIVDAVLERMETTLPEHEFTKSLRTYWTATNELPSDEREFCEAAAMAGMDPFDIDDRSANEIISFWEQWAPSIRRDGLALARGGLLQKVASWLESATDALPEETSNDNKAWQDVRLAALEDSGDFFGSRPWNRGYALARSLRKHLNLQHGHVSLDGMNGNGLSVPWRKVSAPSDRIEGLVGPTAPRCVVARPDQAGTHTRFLAARALGDFLNFGSGYGVLSTLRTNRQAQSRSFAAEFLAPSESLRQEWKSDGDPQELVRELGRNFGVSTDVIRHQLRNHGIADVTARI